MGGLNRVCNRVSIYECRTAAGEINACPIENTIEEGFQLQEPAGLCSLLVFVALWQLVVYFKVPYLQNLPYPRDVAYDAGTAAVTSDYWINWGLSLMRIFIGFIAAQIVGIPLGLAMGISRTFKQYTFPLFEILRPIPPIAWIPLAILFWPTRASPSISWSSSGPFTSKSSMSSRAYPIYRST